MPVCLQDRTRSCAKTAGLIEMPFGKWTRIDPRNQIFGEGLDSLGERAFFGGKERPPWDEAFSRFFDHLLNATNLMAYWCFLGGSWK